MIRYTEREHWNQKHDSKNDEVKNFIKINIFLKQSFNISAIHKKNDKPYNASGSKSLSLNINVYNLW